MVKFLAKKSKALKRYLTSYYAITSSVGILRWSNNEHVRNNWGDALNPVLFKCLSGNHPVHYQDIVRSTLDAHDKPVYTMIGSYLANVRDSGSEIFGTGFMNYDSHLRVEPRAIHAVRGLLTRKKIIETGRECPDVYGDAALLFPLFYRPESRIRYKLGIIAQHRDQGSPLVTDYNDPEVLLIDINSGIYKVVDQINRCERIASSSLHGIIAADSYGIPSAWVKFTDKVLGDGFKFHDYFSSVGRTQKPPLQITENTRVVDILDSFDDEKPSLDIRKLLKACPFLSDEIRSRLDPDVVFKRNLKA